MLARSPLQGDLQGAPGRDPQVHHQGPDRQGLRAAIGLLLLAALVSALPACSGESATTRKELDAKNNSPVGKTPTEGTIIFYDPKPVLRGKRLPPALLQITTVQADQAAKEMPMRVDAGTIEGDAPEKRPTEKDVSREILKRARQRSANVVSPERFSFLWSQLEEAKVFKLPRHRGGIPPEDKPSISLTTQGRTWILVPPPSDSEDFKALYESWKQAKLLIFINANS